MSTKIKRSKNQNFETDQPTIIFDNKAVQDRFDSEKAIVITQATVQGEPKKSKKETRGLGTQRYNPKLKELSVLCMLLCMLLIPRYVPNLAVNVLMFAVGAEVLGFIYSLEKRAHSPHWLSTKLTSLRWRIRRSVQALKIKKTAKFFTQSRTRFWIGVTAIGLCFMQVSPVLIEIYGQNVGYDPDAYRRMQLSASAPGLDKYGNPSWLFWKQSLDSGWDQWVHVQSEGKNQWEKIFSGNGSAYLYAKINSDYARISIRISSDVMDFDCSYGENYFSFSLNDTVDFYYVIVDDFYKSMKTGGCFDEIAVMPQVILKGSVDFTFSDDGDIDTSDIQWINFYGYGELTLLICPDFPMNSLYIGIDKELNGFPTTEILTLHPWGTGQVTDIGNEYNGVPMLYGRDYAEVTEQGKWPQYKFRIDTLGKYGSSENLGLHKLGIGADIKQGADDFASYYSALGKDWTVERTGHVDYLILVDQDWDTDLIPDSDELNKYFTEPTFPENWGYYSLALSSDLEIAQNAEFTFYNNFEESYLYINLYDSSIISEVYLDGVKGILTKNPNDPSLIATNIFVSLGEHKLYFTYQGNYSEDSFTFSIGEYFIYNFPELGVEAKDSRDADSDLDEIPDHSDLSVDTYLKWNPAMIQQLILPTSVEKDTVVNFQIKRPSTDYYELTHNEDEIYLWNGESYVEISPVIRMLGNILAYEGENPYKFEDNYYHIRQPDNYYPIPSPGYYTYDDYDLNTTLSSNTWYWIGLNNLQLSSGYGKDIETFSAVDYDYLSQNRIGDSLAVDWDDDGFPDAKLIDYNDRWDEGGNFIDTGFPVCDNMEFNFATSQFHDETWSNQYDTVSLENLIGDYNNAQWDYNGMGLFNWFGDYGYDYADQDANHLAHTVGPYPTGFPESWINEDLPCPEELNNMYHNLLANLSLRESQIISPKVSNKSYEFSYTIPAGHISKINDGNYDGVEGNDPTLDLKMMVQWEVMNLNYTQINYRDEDEVSKIDISDPDSKYNEIFYYIDIVNDKINIHKVCWDYGDFGFQSDDIILSCSKDRFNLIMPSYFDGSWTLDLTNHWDIENNYPDLWYDSDYLEEIWGCKYGRTDIDTLDHMLIPLNGVFGKTGTPYFMCFYDWDEPIIVQSITEAEYDTIQYFISSTESPIQNSILESIIANPSLWNPTPENLHPYGIDPFEIIYNYQGTSGLEPFIKSISYKDFALNKHLEDVAIEGEQEGGIGSGWGTRTYDFETFPTDWTFGGSTLYKEVEFAGEKKKKVIGISSASHNLYDSSNIEQLKNGSFSIDVAASGSVATINLYDQASGSLAVLLKSKLINGINYWVLDTGIHDGYGEHIIDDLGCKIRSDRWQYLTVSFNAHSDSFGIFWKDENGQIVPIKEQNNYAFYSSDGVNSNQLAKISYLYLTNVYVNEITCGGITQLDTKPIVLYTNNKYTTIDVCKLMHLNDFNNKPNYIGDFFEFDNTMFYWKYAKDQYNVWNPQLYYAERDSHPYLCQHFNDGQTLSQLDWTLVSGSASKEDWFTYSKDEDEYSNQYYKMLSVSDSVDNYVSIIRHNFNDYERDNILLTFSMGVASNDLTAYTIKFGNALSLCTDQDTSNWKLVSCLLEFDTGIKVEAGVMHDFRLAIYSVQGIIDLWIDNKYIGQMDIGEDISHIKFIQIENDNAPSLYIDNIEEFPLPTNPIGDSNYDWDFTGISHDDVIGSNLKYKGTQYNYGLYSSGLYMDDEYAYVGMVDAYGQVWKFDQRPYVETDAYFATLGVDDLQPLLDGIHFESSSIYELTHDLHATELMTYGYGPKIGTSGAQPRETIYVVDKSCSDGLYVKKNSNDEFILNPISQNVVDFDFASVDEIWDEDFNVDFAQGMILTVDLPGDNIEYSDEDENHENDIEDIPLSTQLPIGTIITYTVDQTEFVKGFLGILNDIIGESAPEIDIGYTSNIKTTTISSSTTDLSSSRNFKYETDINNFQVLYQYNEYFNIANDGTKEMDLGLFINKIPVDISLNYIDQLMYENPTKIDYTSQILDIQYAATDIHLDPCIDVYSQIVSGANFKDYVQYIHELYIDTDNKDPESPYWNTEVDYAKAWFDSRWTSMQTNIGDIIWERHSISQIFFFMMLYQKNYQDFRNLNTAWNIFKFPYRSHNYARRSLFGRLFNANLEDIGFDYKRIWNQKITRKINGDVIFTDWGIALIHLFNTQKGEDLEDIYNPHTEGIIRSYYNVFHKSMDAFLRRIRVIGESLEDLYQRSIFSAVEKTTYEKATINAEIKRLAVKRFTDLTGWNYNWLSWDKSEHFEKFNGKYILSICPVLGKESGFQRIEACHIVRQEFVDLFGNIILTDPRNIIFASFQVNHYYGATIYGPWLGLKINIDEVINNLRNLKDNEGKSYYSEVQLKEIRIELEQMDLSYFKHFNLDPDTISFTRKVPVKMNDGNEGVITRQYKSIAMNSYDFAMLYHYNNIIAGDHKSDFNNYLMCRLPDKITGDEYYSRLILRGKIIGTKENSVEFYHKMSQELSTQMCNAFGKALDSSKFAKSFDILDHLIDVYKKHNKFSLYNYYKFTAKFIECAESMVLFELARYLNNLETTNPALKGKSFTEYILSKPDALDGFNKGKANWVKNIVEQLKVRAIQEEGDMILKQSNPPLWKKIKSVVPGLTCIAGNPLLYLLTLRIDHSQDIDRTQLLKNLQKADIERIQFQVSVFFKDGKLRISSQEANLQAFRKQLEMDGSMLSAYSSNLALFIIKLMRASGHFTDLEIAQRIYSMETQSYQSFAKRDALKYALSQYDFAVEIAFYFNSLIVLNAMNDMGVLSDSDFARQLLNLNIALGLDAVSTVAFFFATYYELKVGVSLAFNILGQAFNFVGTIINTGQYFESSDTMDHFDQVIQKIQIACQWMGVLIGLVGIAMSGTTTFWSGLGTLVSVIAWICVGISLIYHAEDPTPVDITDMIWTYNTLRLRQKGCFNVGDSISMSYTFTKYLYKHDVKLYFYQETEWAYNYDDSKTIPSIPLQGSVEMSGEITFSYVGSNIKTWTRICNEYSDTVLNFKDSWPSDVTVTESNVANFYDNIRIIYKNSADFDNDGVSNVLETETYLTDPENIDTDNDDISDGIELGMRCPYTYEDTFTNFNLATKHEYLVSELTKSSNVKEIVSIFGEYGWEQNHVYKQGIDYIVAKTNDLVTLIDWVGGSHAYPLNGKFTVNYRYGQILSDPLDEDSDDDWLLDGTELLFGTEINDIDSDDDKLTDGEEVLIYYTDSLKTDTDGDGLSDYVEVKFGYDPINDYPIVIDSASLDKFEEYALGTDPWGSTPQPWGSAIINGHGSPDRILCIGDMCSRQHALSRTMDTDWSMTLTLEELWMGSLNYRIDAKYNIWFDFLNYDLSTHRIGWAFCPTDTYCWQRYIDSVYTSISNEHPLTCGNWANWIIKWDVSKKDLTFTIDLGSGNVFLIDTYHYVDVKQLTNLKIFNSAPNGQDIGIDCIGYSWNIQNSFTQFAVNADPLYDDDWSLLYGSATITSSGYELTSGRRRFTYFNDMSQDWSFNFLGKVQYINDDTGGMGRYILQLHSSTDKYVNFAYGLTSENFEFKISTDSTWTQADDPDAYPNANEFNQWKVYWDASEFKLQFFFKGYLVCETTLPDGFGSLDSIIFDSVTDGSAGKVTISDYSYNIEDEIPYSNSVDYKGTETFFNFADGSDPWFGEGTAQIINMYQGHHKVYELIDANRHQDVNLAMSQDVVTEAWVNLGQYNSSGSDLPFAICDEAYIYSSQHLVGENVQYKLSKQEIGSVSITGFVKDTDYILVDSSDADTYMDSIRWTGTNRPSEGAIFRVTYSGIEHIDYGGKTLDYYDGRYVMSLHLNNDQKFSFGFYTSGSTIKYQYKWSGFGSSWYDLNWNIANGKDMQWMRWRISWLDAANKFKVEVFEQDNDYTYSSEIQVNELSPMYVIAVDYDCSENTGGFMYIDSPSIVGDGYSIGDLEDTIEAPQIVKIEPNYNENSIDFVWEDADTYNIGVYYSLDSFDIDDIDDFADSGMLPSGIFYNGPFTGGYGSIYLNKGGEYTLIFQSISETCTSFYAEPCVLSTIVEDTICDFSSDTIGNPPSGWIPFTTYSDHTHTVSNDLIEFESGVFQYSLHERLIDNSKLDTITGTYSGHSHEFEIDTDYSLVDSNSDEEYDSILWDNVNHPDVDTDFVVSYQYLNYEVDQTELVEECSVINEWYTDHPITTIPKMFVLTDTSPLSYSYATMSSPIEFEGDMFIDMRLMSDNTQKYSEISFRDEQGATILTFSINHGYLSLQLSDTIYENITMIFNYTLSRFRFNFNTNEQLGQLYLDDIYIGEYQIENCSNIAEIKIATSIAQSDYFIAVDYIACGQQSDSEIDNVGDVSYTFSDTSNVSSVEKELSSTSMENGGDIQGNYYYSADKFAIYDISSISNTELTDLEPIYLSEQSYQDVQVVDNFIYALGTSSITIYDSSDKSKPVIVNSLDIWTPYTIIDTQLIISGHILYLLTEHNGLFVRAYDISNPLDIGLLDTLDTGFIRDSGDPQVKIETLTQNYVLSFIDDADSEGKILLIDISNPNDLAICSTIDTNVVGGINCIATSFGYVYGSYVDTGANKIKIYDIINHYDPRLVATKDISGSYPIYSMDIFENSLYINRQTATGPDAFIFEIYALSCRTNPVYKCSVSPDISGEIILSSNIAIISGTSAIDILQIHYSSDGLDTEVVKGQTMGITTGSIDFQKNTQGIFSVDFLCPEEYNNIMIGLDSTYSGTPVAKFSAESSEMKIFDLYDLNFDLWYTPGDSGTAKIVNVQTPISTSAYEIDNTKRTIVTNLDTDTVDFTIEAMIAIEKESSTTGTYSIQLIDSFGEVFIDLTYNPNTQKWTTLGYQINGGSAGTPDSCEFGTWKIGWSAESFKFYFNGDYIGSQNRINMPSIIKKVVFDDVTAGNCGKMWIAGYRVNSYTEDLMDIIEPELVVGEINTIKVLFDCTKLNAMIFANGNFEGIFSMFEGSIHAENGIPYLNSVSFSSSLLIDNLKWTSLDEDLDKDGLPNECFYSTSSTDADSDDDGMPDGWEIEMGLNPLVNDASGDPDDDGLTNLQELTLGTSAICTDSDHDYMSDGWEVAYDLNPIKPYDAQLDSNDDGISNLIVCLSSRIYLNTYPLDPTIENPADSDGDTMPDAWEMFWRLDPTSNSDKEQDPDSDYLTNYMECAAGTNPYNKDTDDDTMWDKWELDNDLDPLDPEDADDDNDQDDFTFDQNFEFRNDDEFFYGLNPNDPDTDDDTYPDGYEVYMVTHPSVTDADQDQMIDSWERTYGFRPYCKDDNTEFHDGPNDDWDFDGLTNIQECNVYHTYPKVADSDGDGLSDGVEVNTYGTDPMDKTTDADSLEDGFEVLTFGSNPFMADTDSDGLDDGEEYLYGTNPNLQDTDDDGLNDGPEVKTYATNPLTVDYDNDGLVDGTEVAGHQYWDPFKQGGAGYITVYTLPKVADTDGDGLLDGEELGITETHHDQYTDTPLYFATLGSPDNYPTSHGSLAVRRTNPNDWDSDNDGASDGDNAGVFEWDDSNPNDKHWKTDPLSGDTDGDTLGGSAVSDYTEMHGWDIHYDSDSDTVLDTWLYGVTSNPRKTDSDGDNIGDLYEYTNGYNPNNADWDGDGLKDNEELLYMNGQGGVHYHHQHDAQGNPIEGSDLVTWTSNPWDADTDGDGLTDHEEMHGRDPTNHPTWYSNPNTAHSDSGDNGGDTLTDYEEYWGTFHSSNQVSNPRAKDTDNDGYNDYIEEYFCYNPSSASSYPSYYYDYSANTCTQVAGDQITVEGGSSVSDAISFSGGASYVRDRDGWPYVTSYEIKYKFSTFAFPTSLTYYNRKSYISAVGCSWKIRGASNYSGTTTVKELKITVWNSVGTSDNHQYTDTWTVNTWYPTSGGGSIQWSDSLRDGAKNNGYAITTVQVQLHVHTGGLYNAFVDTDMLRVWYYIAPQ